MTGIMLTRGAIAAGVDTLRRQVAEADDTIGACIAQAGLDMLHAILCCAEDAAREDVPAWDDEPEAEPEPEPEPDASTDTDTLSWSDADIAAQDAPAPRGKTWTPERLAMLRQDYASAPSVVAMHSALNALPGPPIASWNSVAKMASVLGIAKRPSLGRQAAAPAAEPAPAEAPVAPAPLPAAAQQAPQRAAPRPAAQPEDNDPEAADRAALRRQDDARRALRDGKGPVEIAAATKLPLREVFRLKGELREEARQAGGGQDA